MEVDMRSADRTSRCGESEKFKAAMATAVMAMEQSSAISGFAQAGPEFVRRAEQ
jgi:hypothetical protein